MVMGSSTSLLRVGGLNPFTPRDCFWNVKYLMQKDFQYLQTAVSSKQQEVKIGKILCFVQRKILSFEQRKILCFVQRKFLFSRIPRFEGFQGFIELFAPGG